MILHLGMACIYSKDPSVSKTTQFDWQQQEIWLVFNSRSNLIGVTYISHWYTEPPVHNISDVPTKRYLKKITQK